METPCAYSIPSDGGVIFNYGPNVSQCWSPYLSCWEDHLNTLAVLELLGIAKVAVHSFIYPLVHCQPVIHLLVHAAVIYVRFSCILLEI